MTWLPLEENREQLAACERVLITTEWWLDKEVLMAYVTTQMDGSFTFEVYNLESCDMERYFETDLNGWMPLPEPSDF